MTSKQIYDNLVNTLTKDGVSISPKASSKFWTFLNWLVILVTFGKNRTFLSSYLTTIGNSIATPTSWDEKPPENKIELLTHEYKHVKQFRRYGLILTGITYLLLPLPMGLAYFRYRFERVAYAAGFKAYLAFYPQVRSNLIDHGVEQICGPAYGFTWPFRTSVRAWFEANV